MIERKRTRVESRKWITLAWPGGNCQGELLNLSLKGCLIRNTAGRTVDLGRDVEVAIHLEPQTPELDVNLKGRIVRVEDETIAVEFFEVELESFRHLLGLVQYNSPDPDSIGNELAKSAFGAPASKKKQRKTSKQG